MTQDGKSPEEIIRNDGRYPAEAFAFLQEGFDRAVQEVYGKGAARKRDQHVTGQQICCSLRKLAVERWGLLAKTVLAKWNIHETMDFGNMVYLLIHHRLMGKSEEDSIDHFRDVYDFTEAFCTDGHFELKE